MRNRRKRLQADSFAENGSSEKENSAPSSQRENNGLLSAQHEIHAIFDDLIRDAFPVSAGPSKDDDEGGPKPGQDDLAAKREGANVFVINQVVNMLAGSDLKQKNSRKAQNTNLSALGVEYPRKLVEQAFIEFFERILTTDCRD